MTVRLRGISWDHVRGMGPLVGTLSKYRGIAPEVEITWTARSLQAFGDRPLEALAEEFDLLVIDHPFVGRASAGGLLVPLDRHLPSSVLEHLATNSVGPSHRSYQIDGHQWALAIDAAVQVSALRADIFQRFDLTPPRSWREAIAVAEELRRHGYDTAVPLNPTDVVPVLYSLAASLGEPAFSVRSHVLSPRGGVDTLRLLRQLHQISCRDSRESDPPHVLESMATADHVAYAPILFGYSNYARPGFRNRVVSFTDLPSIDGLPQGSCLGGAGFAVSSRCEYIEEAVAYGAWLASGRIQRNEYFAAGGQPAHRSAWLDSTINAKSNDFFCNTIATVDAAYLRPRFDGYHQFQLAAGHLLADWLASGRSSLTSIVDALDAQLAAVDRGLGW